MEFLVGDAFTDRSGHTNFCDDFVAAQSGGEHPSEEFRRRDHALTGAAVGDDLSIEREHCGRIISCGMGLGERAADGAAVADLSIADVRGGLRQQRRETQQILR